MAALATNVTFTPIASFIQENSLAQGQTIGTITFNSNDPADVTLTPSFNPNDACTIIGDGTTGFSVVVNNSKAINYEAYSNPQLSFADLIPDDPATPVQDPVPWSFAINVADANDAPSDLSLSGLTVQELAALGTVVGTLAAIDADAGDTFTYSIVNPTDGRFRIEGNKLIVADGLKFDYERSSSQVLTIRVTDRSGASFDKILGLGVLDVEDEVTAGSAAADIFTGGKGNDKFGGGPGNDTLLGGAGNDTLAGGLGKDLLFSGIDKDVFIFDTKPNKRTNVDILADFDPKFDSIYLENKIFKAAGKKGFPTKPALLNKNMFYAGSSAHDHDDHVIYNKKTGALYYDADGIGGHARIKIASLSPSLHVSYKDFFVI